MRKKTRSETGPSQIYDRTKQEPNLDKIVWAAFQNSVETVKHLNTTINCLIPVGKPSLSPKMLSFIWTIEVNSSGGTTLCSTQGSLCPAQPRQMRWTHMWLPTKDAHPEARLLRQSRTLSRPRSARPNSGACCI